MGWDAYAVDADGNTLETSDDGRLVKKRYRRAFEAAEHKVKRLVSTVDFLLSTGGLDVSDCGRQLALATLDTVYAEDGWSPKKVAMLNFTAQWKCPENEDDIWAYYSARAFLEACARCGLGIKFTW